MIFTKSCSVKVGGVVTGIKIKHTGAIQFIVSGEINLGSHRKTLYISLLWSALRVSTRPIHFRHHLYLVPGHAPIWSERLSPWQSELDRTPRLIEGRSTHGDIRWNICRSRVSTHCTRAGSGLRTPEVGGVLTRVNLEGERGCNYSWL